MRREYERYEMSNLEIMEQYFSRVTNLVNKMRVYGEDIPESKVVEKILRTILMKFDHMVTTIIESHNTDTMTITELQGSIESHSKPLPVRCGLRTNQAEAGGHVRFRLRLEMPGRGRGVRITNDLLEQMTQVLEALVHDQDAKPAEYRGLSAFTKHNLPKFEGKFDPEGA
ncbi:uncharacterized protein LOC113874223 [Abrus precatorius]|uniref:Uncharacterized protein LOC113874223 n=1 Tax=Abrus precatorius TaxID=3816 RepID=A0A8B8MKW7_ABRPR|nr:uncharacterized protein LOC113874223 [Abrus precatorius]